MSERRSITLTSLPQNVKTEIGTYFYAPFNKQGSAATAAVYEGGLYDEDAELTIANGVSSNWSDRGGWFTPTDVTANYVTWSGNTTDTDDAFWDKLRLTTSYAYSGILIAFDFYYTTNPSETEGILGCGEISIAAGGWQVLLATVGGTGKIQADIRVDNDSYGTAWTAVPKDQRNSVIVYYDFINARANLIINGGAVVQGIVWEEYMTDVRGAQRCVALLAAGNALAPSAKKLGEGGSVASVKNYFMLRPTTDISDNLVPIATAFHDNENTIPADLITLGVIGG